MIFASRLQRIMLAATIAISGVVSASSLSVAQEGPDFEPGYYQSMLTGYDVDISGDTFVIDDVVQQNYSEGENEQIRINGTLDDDVPALLEVSFLDDEDTPDETIDLWVSGISEDMDEFEIVATGLDGSVYWYYIEGVLEGQDVAFYIQVDEDVEGNVDVLESVLTVDGYLLDAVETGQQDVSVDGDEFLDDVDLDELQSLVDGGPFRDGGSDDSPEKSNDDDSNNNDEDSGPGRERNPSNRDDDDADATQEAGS